MGVSSKTFEKIRNHQGTPIIHSQINGNFPEEFVNEEIKAQNSEGATPAFYTQDELDPERPNSSQGQELHSSYTDIGHCT